MKALGFGFCAVFYANSPAVAKTLAIFMLLKIVTATFALECEISSGNNERELRKLAKSCLSGNDTVDSFLDLHFSKETDDSGASEEIYRGPKRQFSTRVGRSDRSEEENETKNATNVVDEGEEVNVTVVARNCVIQCVLQKLELTDAEGYPVHHRLLEVLMKPNFRTELRDFLEDSTDECFLSLEQEVEKPDACSYSSKLIACLADKGRMNCADWPVGNIQFQQG